MNEMIFIVAVKTNDEDSITSRFEVNTVLEKYFEKARPRPCEVETLDTFQGSGVPSLLKRGKK